jgi:hypothetical protein
LPGKKFGYIGVINTQPSTGNYLASFPTGFEREGHRIRITGKILRRQGKRFKQNY